MLDKTCLNAVLSSKMVNQTVKAYNAIEGKSHVASKLRVRTLSQIALGIPYKAMRTLGIKGFNHHKFSAARSHAKCYGPGQDPFETTRRTRVQLSKDLVIKCVQFLDDPKFLQDVAYGAKKLDLGEGKTYEIPGVLRKLLPEKLWQQYEVVLAPTLTLTLTPILNYPTCITRFDTVKLTPMATSYQEPTLGGCQSKSG